MESKEVKDVREIEEVKEKGARAWANSDSGIAAFFDLDGTLMPLPSLERRFFRILRYRRVIALKNYFLWLREALRLLPHGTGAITHENKMYLHGVQSLDESAAENCSVPSAHTSGHPERLFSDLRASQAGGQASAAPPKRSRRNPRLPVPLFFEAGVECVAWHVIQGHAIVLVSGTLEPLANAAARELQAQLERRGIAAKIRVCATRLGETGGRWTGRIVGEAMFGKAKARAVRSLAQEMQLDLSQCYSYGDSDSDEAMLTCVGNPVAVNPSRKLGDIMRKRGWPVLRCHETGKLTKQNPQKTERSRGKTTEATNASVSLQAE